MKLAQKSEFTPQKCLLNTNIYEFLMKRISSPKNSNIFFYQHLLNSPQMDKRQRMCTDSKAEFIILWNLLVVLSYAQKLYLCQYITMV